MMWWWWCGLRVLCCGGSYDVVASQCSQSYLCGVCVIQSNNNNFYFYLLFSGSSVLSLGSLCSQGLMLWWSRGLMVWWSYLCGGVVLLIVVLNNRCGVLWGQVFWVLCKKGGSGVAGIRK